MAVAIWFRVFRINQIPPGIFVDETNAALDAIRILEGRPDSPFGTGWYETPTMYAYYLVGLFRLLGTSFAALKMASLLPAILTIAAFYPLVRLMFGVPTAFAATLILAANRWHITMSRWGWNEVAPLLFLIGALFFLIRAIRDRRALDFALGGLLLGLGHYTYLASRLVLIAVVCYLLYRVLFERGFLGRNWRGLLLFLLVYVVVVAPLGVTYGQTPSTFTNRSQQVSILNDMQAYYLEQRAPAPRWVGYAFRAVGLPKEISLLPLQESVLRHLEMFHAFGDRNPRHNIPGAPMLDPVTGSFMVLGLGFALWMVFFPRGVDPDPTRRVPGISGGHRYALLLLWLLVPLLGGILTRLDEAPQAYRTLPVVGAVALLAGDAVVRSARVLADALDRSSLPARGRRWLPWASLAILLLWLAILNYRAFFGVQAQDGRVWQAFSPVETTAATEVAAKMKDHNLYLSPRLYYFSPLRFLTYRSPQEGGGGLDEPAYQVADPLHGLPVSDPFAQDALFLLDTYYEDVPELFLTYYPGSRFEMVEGPGGQPLYLSVTVPGDEVRALQGLRATYQTGPDTTVERSATAVPRLNWPADLAEEAGPDALARWEGSLKVPGSGHYDLIVDGPAQLSLDGEPWTDGRFLSKGLHAIRVEQVGPGSDAEITLSWRGPGQTEPEPVPPTHLFQVDPATVGLTASYYANELWEGEPAFQRVDPVLLFAWPESEPWPTPFSARWTGTLTIPTEGEYRFQIHADDGVRLWIDGQLVGEGVIPDAVNLVDVQVPLSAGSHEVQIDYFQRAGGKALEFWWQPPGEHLQPVSSRVLGKEQMANCAIWRVLDLFHRKSSSPVDLVNDFIAS
jgi:4-amino-4-deoxy-L-arabinose transferase-like glycosyltransferase